MLSVSELLLALLFIGLVAGCLGIWIAIFSWVRAGESPLSFTPRRSAPWGGIEVGVLVLWYMVLITAALAMRSRSLPSTSDDLETHFILYELAVNAVLDVAIAVLLLFFLRVVRGATSRDLGIDLSRWKDDLMIGAGGLLAAVGPVYAIQHVISEWTVEEKHPILEVIVQSGSTAEIIAAVLTAVVLAPLFEEFVFRVLIQGWLEKALALPRMAQQPAESILVTPHSADPESLEPAPFTWPEAPVAEERMVTEHDLPSRALAAVPIVLSSLLFAAAHVNAWPSPIPLFPLALILGYIYWRTHRLLPCVVVHALFNGLSVLAVGLGPR
ncbi:MAG: CPBP family intramembrane glutamic endopeptidase [Pirellulales bacterium]